jgi:hypothetical protein
MKDKDAVKHFLKEFKEKKKIWSVLFRDDRDKNFKTLIKLEITPVDREKVLEGLVVTDYCEGPIEDKLYGGADMWVFGRQVKGHEIYIKISLGMPGSQVICISFHIAEHPMSYPFK